MINFKIVWSWPTERHAILSEDGSLAQIAIAWLDQGYLKGFSYHYSSCLFMLNFSKKEQPEERIIPKTFCRSFKFMLNFQLLQFEIWLIFPFHLTGLVRRSISSANSTIMFQTVLTHFWLVLLVFCLKANRLETYTTSRQAEIGEFWSITGALHMTTQKPLRRPLHLTFFSQFFNAFYDL